RRIESICGFLSEGECGRNPEARLFTNHHGQQRFAHAPRCGGKRDQRWMLRHNRGLEESAIAGPAGEMHHYLAVDRWMGGARAAAQHMVSQTRRSLDGVRRWLLQIRWSGWSLEDGKKREIEGQVLVWRLLIFRSSR